MSNINKLKLRKYIRNEVKKLVDEDALFDPPQLGEPNYLDLDLEHCPECEALPCPGCGDTHHEPECPLSLKKEKLNGSKTEQYFL